VKPIFSENGEVEDISDEGEWAESNINSIDLRHYISLLTPKQKEVAFLKAEGYSQSEIAEKMDCSQENICQTLKACRKKYLKFIQNRIA
jgi:RNA polymerase sigma factor (sigma-70 family)